MLLLEGTPVSTGYASGIATVYEFEIERRLELPHRAIEHSEVDSECDRLDRALDRSNSDRARVEQAALKQSKLADSTAILSAHSMMAGEIAKLVRQHIRLEFVNVEQALDAVVGDFVDRLQHLDNVYLREREQDVCDVDRQLRRQLAACTTHFGDRLPAGCVVVARELLPSETVELAASGVVAIVAERGGKYSHTAIIARSMGIPAITGIHNATSRITAGTRLLVDGEVGTVIASPETVDEQRFANRLREFTDADAAAELASKEDQPCVTPDGVEISLVGNINGPFDVERIDEQHLGGVGLFRTEFLFLESHEQPGVEVQAELYDRMAAGLKGLPMVIRTFDLGGDKTPPFLQLDEPAAQATLHLRGLRFSLAERSLLDTQLQAIVRTAQTHDVRVLFPMVIGIDDLARAVAAVDRVVSDFGAAVRPAVGAMIETPAALFALDEICELADFVAIGTNDLTQFMLAADRDLSDGTVNCSALHPAVLRAVKRIIEAAGKRDCPVCVCGEDAGDADFAGLLVGLGVRELSVSPARAAAVRQAIRQIDSNVARRVARLALQCRTPQEVREVLARASSIRADGDHRTAKTGQAGPIVTGEHDQDVTAIRAAARHVASRSPQETRKGQKRAETAIVYCEANFGDIDGKTANGLVRHSEKYDILAVIDSEKAGLDSGTVLDDEPNAIPICRDLADAMTHSVGVPDCYIFGMAPASGMLSSSERALLLDAIDLGMDVVNGLHEFLNDYPEFIAASAAANVRIDDVRKPRDKTDLRMFSGRIADVSCPRIAVLGTDCAIGKRTTATVITRALNEAGLKTVLVGTGQTGLMQGARYGVSLDAVPSQFCAGELEAAIIDAFERENPDVIIIEGQGALSHPAFSTSSFILRGSCPDAVVLQHAPGRSRRCDFPQMPMPIPATEINLIQNFSNTKVIGVTINHENMTDGQVSDAIVRYEAELGIPCTDALTRSPRHLIGMVLAAFPQLEENLNVCTG